MYVQDNDAKSGHAVRGKTRALVLVPTRELCEQTKRAFQALTYYCIDRLSVVSVGGGAEKKGGGVNSAQIAALAERPEVVIGTPSRLVQV